jgi:hypothetical protein
MGSNQCPHVYTVIADEYWWMKNKHHHMDDLLDGVLMFNLPSVFYIDRYKQGFVNRYGFV